MVLNSIPDQLVFLPKTCQQAVLRAACFSIYKPYTVELNATIPCQAVCNDIHASCGKLLPLLVNMSNFEYLNCSSSLYSIANNTCYPDASIAPANASTSSANPSVARYNYSADGICADMTRDVYIPGIHQTPWESPANMGVPDNRTQAGTEHALLSFYSLVPPWLSSHCQISMRQYFCASNYLSPQTVLLRDLLNFTVLLNNILMPQGLEQSALYAPEYWDDAFLLNYSVVIPRLPEREICSKYQEDCSAYIQEISVYIPALRPNCSYQQAVQVAPGEGEQEGPLLYTDYYPQSQGREGPGSTVAYLYMYNHSYINNSAGGGGSSITLPLHSTPVPALGSVQRAWVEDHPTSSSHPYLTNCPAGFVVPDHPGDPRVQWIPPSGCAIACMIPIYTVAEWEDFILTARVVSRIGLVLILLFLYQWTASPSRRDQQMLICLAVGSALHSLMSTIVYTLDWEDVHCVDNNVAFDASDGLSACGRLPYMCMYVCMYIYIYYVCMYIYIYIMYVCIYICI